MGSGWCALFSYYLGAGLILDGPLLRMEEDRRPDCFFSPFPFPPLSRHFPSLLRKQNLATHHISILKQTTWLQSSRWRQSGRWAPLAAQRLPRFLRVRWSFQRFPGDSTASVHIRITCGHMPSHWKSTSAVLLLETGFTWRSVNREQMASEVLLPRARWERLGFNGFRRPPPGR